MSWTILSAWAVAGALAAMAAGPAPFSPQGAAGTAEIVPRYYLVLPRAGRSGRSPVHTDAVEDLLASGRWAPPSAGASVALPDGTSVSWEAVEAGPDGALALHGRGGGYAYTSVTSAGPRIMLLEAQGDDLVYVNGELRAGDPYGYGWVRLPIELHAGRNDLLFHGSRGRLKARLVAPSSPALLNTGDATLPDLIVGERARAWGAAVVINASRTSLKGASLRASGPGLSAVETPLPAIPPLSVRKVGFRIEGASPRREGTIDIRLDIRPGRAGESTAPASGTVHVRVRRPEESRKVTFRSAIDGSIQYYALLPAQPIAASAASREDRSTGSAASPEDRSTGSADWRAGGSSRPALFLSLHGAGVEAIGQADAYEPKSWGYLVAPTNRRPYGFDWEDWGRLDALEVLDLAERSLPIDPERVYLTGHSMGGHGTWIFGATYSDRFAAIGPSAGWISFRTYAGGRREEVSNRTPTAIEAILDRAADPSDTLSLSENYKGLGVYILHGSADDNVPVTEARRMAARLAEFHHDFVFHEQPGVGHWWDVSDEPGADCVDWAPMFDFFGRHARPTDAMMREVDFTTASPGVSARSDWLEIDAQVHPLAFSHAVIRFDPGKRRYVGTTDNVALLSLELAGVAPGAPMTVELDGQTIAGIPWPREGSRLWLARHDGRWSVGAAPSPDLKGLRRYGPFKEAFRHRMVFVYGTKGTAEENAWAFARARYDAETFWYRGNGSVDMLPDSDFDPASDRDRSVILYGNAQTNAAWKPLLDGSPVQVDREGVRAGGREVPGEDLACLFLRPRPGSDVASVAAVSGTGIAGMRLTDRLPYFTSGVAFPDWIVIGPEMLSRGMEGVRAAGFFGQDWGVESGDLAVGEPR